MDHHYPFLLPCAQMLSIWLQFRKRRNSAVSCLYKCTPAAIRLNTYPVIPWQTRPSCQASVVENFLLSSRWDFRKRKFSRAMNGTCWLASTWRLICLMHKEERSRSTATKVRCALWEPLPGAWYEFASGKKSTALASSPCSQGAQYKSRLEASVTMSHKTWRSFKGCRTHEMVLPRDTGPICHSQTSKVSWEPRTPCRSLAKDKKASDSSKRRVSGLKEWAVNVAALRNGDQTVDEISQDVCRTYMAGQYWCTSSVPKVLLYNERCMVSPAFATWNNCHARQIQHSQ